MATLNQPRPPSRSVTSRQPQRRHLLATATLCCCAVPLAAAQAEPAAASTSITITGRQAADQAGIAGFGEVPLLRSPFSATVLNAERLQDAGIASLGDITRLDAALTDAYNAPGYWGQLAARGYTLDNRYNFRRDGLPINGETALPMANKASLELLKGTSGLQAGTSAPGGLLNLVVKRPLARALRAGSIEWIEPGTVNLAADIAGRAGSEDAFGWRLNAQAARLDPATRDSQGRSHLLAGAFDWRLSPATLLEAELETSRQSQPSTPGFSLLGDQLPDARRTDPRLNLNNQAWTGPVVFEGQTGSVGVKQALGDAWQARARLLKQSLTTEDRIAFPYGCSAENRYDRYCSDGSFDFYDFRSEGERRNTQTAELALEGSTVLAGLRHHLGAGLLHTRSQARFQRQAYNFVGTGFVDGSARVGADPALTDENTQRDERSTEGYLQDRIELTNSLQLWLGLRYTRLQRDSVRTDGSRATAYAQDFSTPWAAVSWQATPTLMAYASSGQGIESEVAPNRARYVNAGQALPALKSRQWELGLKQRLPLAHATDTLQWQVALFSIERPASSDIRVRSGLDEGACSDAAPCLRQADGVARHRGLEAEAEWNAGPLAVRGSVLALQARRQGAANPERNGRRPTNVPERSAKLQAAWSLPSAPGLALLGFLSHEGSRMVLPDNSVATTGWTRVDLGLRYAQRVQGGARWVWRFSLENVANRRAWKESPYQFGHAYLYPLAPRTVRAALDVTL